MISCDTVLQHYLVLAAVEEARSAPTEIIHLVGERSLSLHLLSKSMRPYNRIQAEKILTALTRSMEYGRSSVYALMILLNLEVVDQLKADGEV